MFPIDLYINWRWPVNVKIRIARRNGEEWYFDRAKRIRDKETKKEYYLLRKMKAKAKVAIFKNMIRTNKGLWVEFYSPSKYEYYPCKIEEVKGEMLISDDGLMPCYLTKEEVITLNKGKSNESKTERRGEVIPMDEDQKMFWADVVHHANERWNKESWWAKNAAVIIPVLFIAMMAFGFMMMAYAYNEYLVPGMGRVNSGLNNLIGKFDILFETAKDVKSDLPSGAPPP